MLAKKIYVQRQTFLHVEIKCKTDKLLDKNPLCQSYRKCCSTIIFIV